MYEEQNNLHNFFSNEEYGECFIIDRIFYSRWRKLLLKQKMYIAKKGLEAWFSKVIGKSESNGNGDRWMVELTE